MNTVSALGILLTIVGAAGYLTGVAVAYPGREFSLTALMFGVAVIAVARSDVGEDGE